MAQSLAPADPAAAGEIGVLEEEVARLSGRKRAIEAMLEAVNERLQRVRGPAPAAPAAAAPVAAEAPVAPVATGLLALHDDFIAELFKCVQLPVALKLTCRALRAAGPKETETRPSHVVHTPKLLQWAEGLGLPLTAKVCEAAAGAGCADTLRYARAQGFAFDKDDCACSAATGGHLHVLQMPELGSFDGVLAAFNAASAGHLHVLQWVHIPSWSADDEDDKELADTAARHGHVHIVEWLAWVDKTSCDWGRLLREAAMGGELEMFKWLLAQKPAVSRQAWRNVCGSAARGGSVPLLKLALENSHYPKRIPAHVCEAAVQARQLDVLKYLHQQETKFDWKGKTCLYLSDSGDLPCLKWAREMGFDWTPKLCNNLGHNGALAELQWAVANGAPFDWFACRQAALCSRAYPPSAGAVRVAAWIDGLYGFSGERKRQV